MVTPVYYLPVIRTEARILCLRLLDDLSWAQKILNTRDFNATLVLYRYEDLAANPREAIQAIYNDLSLDLPDSVVRYLDRVTRAAEDVIGHLSLLRKNSGETAVKWRRRLPEPCQEVISKQPACVDVLGKLNYEI